MVAKVPKVRDGVKKQPHLRKITKSIVKNSATEVVMHRQRRIMVANVPKVRDGVKKQPHLRKMTKSIIKNCASEVARSAPEEATSAQAVTSSRYKEKRKKINIDGGDPNQVAGVAGKSVAKIKSVGGKESTVIKKKSGKGKENTSIIKKAVKGNMKATKDNIVLGGDITPAMKRKATNKLKQIGDKSGDNVGTAPIIKKIRKATNKSKKIGGKSGDDVGRAPIIKKIRKETNKSKQIGDKSGDDVGRAPIIKKKRKATNKSKQIGDKSGDVVGTAPIIKKKRKATNKSKQIGAELGDYVGTTPIIKKKEPFKKATQKGRTRGFQKEFPSKKSTQNGITRALQKEFPFKKATQKGRTRSFQKEFFSKKATGGYGIRPLQQKSTPFNNNKKYQYEEATPISLVLDIQGSQNINKINSKKTQKMKKEKKENQNKRDKELVQELFGDLSVEGGNSRLQNISDESSLPHIVKKGENVKETKGNIPHDPYDIHTVDDSSSKKKPAWVDDEDETVRVRDVVATRTKKQGNHGIRETSEKKYEIELREKFSNVYGGTPDWADLNNKPTEESDDEDIVRATGNYLSDASSASLPKNILEYKQMLDLNSSYSEGVFIKAIDFNPNLNVGLVAGTTSRLGAASLFQVDGNTNHRLHSVRFPDYPISSAQFLRDGRKFVVGSEKNHHFYVYDMETSKETKLYISKRFEKGVKKNLYVSPDGEILIYLGGNGKIYIYDAKTLSLIDMMEAPHMITAATFNSDGSRMYTHGMAGEVCIWDMTARECVQKFLDDGCLAGYAIAMSPNNQYLACGSTHGIVNIYDSASLSTSFPAPVKVLSNLTTTITELAFNASSEILAMTSNHKENATKLVHFPSMTTFQNFPRQGKVLKKIESLRFSPHSGYFAVGDSAGAALLFRLKHFSSY